MFKSYSNKTFYGNVRTEQKPYIPYDMLYDQTPYNPKAKRGDRREQKISWRNIWDQEKDKSIPSTSYYVLGRPKRKQIDYAIKEFCRKTEDKEYRSKRLQDALQWVLPLDMSKFTPL